MFFRQMSESVDISVADGRGCYCKSCRRDDAAVDGADEIFMVGAQGCLLYTSPSPRDVEESRMPSSA